MLSSYSSREKSKRMLIKQSHFMFLTINILSLYRKQVCLAYSVDSKHSFVGCFTLSIFRVYTQNNSLWRTSLIQNSRFLVVSRSTIVMSVFPKRSAAAARMWLTFRLSQVLPPTHLLTSTISSNSASCWTMTMLL